MKMTQKSDFSSFSTQSIWKRARTYLIALGATAIGFFFLAGWLATPNTSDDLQPWVWGATMFVGVVAGLVGTGGRRAGRHK